VAKAHKLLTCDCTRVTTSRYGDKGKSKVLIKTVGAGEAFYDNKLEPWGLKS